MTKVVLHGELAEKYNPEYNLAIKAPNEAIRALCNVVPGFMKTFREGSYYLFVETPDNRINIDENNITFNVNGDVHIMPEIVGAKHGGLGKILAGIALVAIAFVPGGVVAEAASAGFEAGGMGMAAAMGSLAFTTLTTVGMSLILGGASQMLAPKTKSSSTDKSQSYLINGSDVQIQNSAAVPIIYGEVLAGSLLVSQEITDAQPTTTTVDNLTNTNPVVLDTATGWFYVGGTISWPSIP